MPEAAAPAFDVSLDAPAPVIKDDFELDDLFGEAVRTQDPLPAVPSLLKSTPNWVEWCLQGKKDKLLKVSGTKYSRNAESDNPATWVSYETLLANGPTIDSTRGVGFVLNGEQSKFLVAYDIDGCRNAATGEIAEWAKEILVALGNPYTEITPSGTGLRPWVVGTSAFPGDGKKEKFLLAKSCGFGDKVQIEIFRDGQYVTVTGNQLAGTSRDIPERGDLSGVFQLCQTIADKYPPAIKPRKKKRAEPRLIVGGKPIESVPDSGFKALFDAVGFEPLVRRLNKHIDSRFHDMKLGAGEPNTYCPIPSHGEQDVNVEYQPCFGVWPQEPAVLHCFGCDWSGDMVAACYEVDGDDTKTMYDVARAICIEENLKFEDYFPSSIQQPAAPDKSKQSSPLAFKFPALPSPPFDFVIDKQMGASEGWFPRGDPSLIGGPSGGNKTTFMVDLLETQRKGESFLGHKTFGLPYVILMADRGQNAHLRTAARMRFNPDDVPIKFLPMAQGQAAIQAILRSIEECDPLPAAVFIEGCDMLVENASKMESVTPFMKGLQMIAKHYHLAIVGSVGSAKQKIGEGYISKRDHIFGSIAWSRMSETIAVIQYLEGDDMDNRRTLSVLPRNAAPEKYKLKLENGRLVVDNATLGTKLLGSSEIAWFRSQTEWFTVRDVETALDLSYSTAYRRTQDAFTKHILKSKKKADGEARQYLWNEGPTNPENKVDAYL